MSSSVGSRVLSVLEFYWFSSPCDSLLGIIGFSCHCSSLHHIQRLITLPTKSLVTLHSDNPWSSLSFRYILLPFRLLTLTILDHPFPSDTFCFLSDFPFDTFCFSWHLHDTFLPNIPTRSQMKLLILAPLSHLSRWSLYQGHFFWGHILTSVKNVPWYKGAPKIGRDRVTWYKDAPKIGWHVLVSFNGNPFSWFRTSSKPKFSLLSTHISNGADKDVLIVLSSLLTCLVETTFTLIFLTIKSLLKIN